MPLSHTVPVPYTVPVSHRGCRPLRSKNEKGAFWGSLLLFVVGLGVRVFAFRGEAVLSGVARAWAVGRVLQLLSPRAMFALKVRDGEPFPPFMSSPVGSTLSAASSAIAGIRRAGEMHEQAADTVHRAFHGPESATPLRANEPAATLSLSTVSQDLAGAFTDMVQADGLNRANVAVIKTTDEMTRELTDLLA